MNDLTGIIIVIIYAIIVAAWGACKIGTNNKKQAFMINKLSQRHSCENVENYAKYVVKCPTCGTILNFGKDDVYKAEDNMCIHHEYIDCLECNESIQLNDDYYFGYQI